MKTKLKRCLAILLIVTTCFCMVDNNFTISKFFASIFIPNSYAEEPTETSDSEEDIQNFKSKMVEIMRGMVADTYTCVDESTVHAPFTYHWGGDGTRETGLDGVSYCTYDCRGLVAATIRYASRELSFHDDKLGHLYIGGTKTQYDDLTATGLWGCHKINSVDDLETGDILWRSGHTELFFITDDGKTMEGGACRTSRVFKKAEKYGGEPGTCEPNESIIEYPYDGSWEAYFRYGTESDYHPTGTINPGSPEDEEGNLGPGRDYQGAVDEKAELDEQVFDFQGNPQVMIFEGESSINLWLFTLLSQFMDFIAGLLVSLLINPIMQLLNAIVNFLTNFINQISGITT